MQETHSASRHVSGMLSGQAQGFKKKATLFRYLAKTGKVEVRKCPKPRENTQLNTRREGLMPACLQSRRGRTNTKATKSKFRSLNIRPSVLEPNCRTSGRLRSTIYRQSSAWN